MMLNIIGCFEWRFKIDHMLCCRSSPLNTLSTISF